MLGEPFPTQFDLNFQIFGIHVRVHPFFWLVSVIFGARGVGSANASLIAIGILTWVVAVFISILVHELGHAFMMIRYGEKVRIVLYGMGGLAIRDSTYSFYSQPPRRDTMSQVLISAAGPGAGFLLAAAVLLLLIAAPTTGVGVYFLLGVIPLIYPLGVQNIALAEFASAMLFINIFWGIINLMPVFPLDGGQIARALMVHWDAWDGLRKSLWLSVIAGAIIAVLSLRVSIFMTIMFGILAYQSYQQLQQISGGRPW